ncbi:hypothetical protein Fmac_012565 [Flemingia macrophylla]|uniref:Uncharacterized protein n=1 Tax=Flemingia macrophylla TaxID=520843 RepID=A0ABD1MQP6_9FABA
MLTFTAYVFAGSSSSTTLLLFFSDDCPMRGHHLVPPYFAYSDELRAKWRVNHIRYYDLMEELWGVDRATGHMARTVRQAHRNISTSSLRVDLNDDVDNIPESSHLIQDLIQLIDPHPMYGIRFKAN